MVSPESHQHSSRHSIATLAGCITNHNQNITAGVANSSDTTTTVSLSGVAICCNLMAWQAAVICTERGTAFGRYCDCYGGVGKDIIRTLWKII